MGEILPLAFTMMVGPQIITSIILVTAKNVVRPSLAYILGVAVASLSGTLAFSLLAQVFDWTVGGTNDPSPVALFLQTALILLLIFASIRTYMKRKTITLPKWMSKLQDPNSREMFKLGLLLILLMPSDLVIMATVGINLASNSGNQIALFPFIALTVLIAAMPLIFYLFFRKRAVKLMPKVREWMNGNSWVVSIAAYVIFIILLWG